MEILINWACAVLGSIATLCVMSEIDAFIERVQNTRIEEERAQIYITSDNSPIVVTVDVPNEDDLVRYLAHLNYDGTWPAIELSECDVTDSGYILTDDSTNFSIVWDIDTDSFKVPTSPYIFWEEELPAPLRLIAIRLAEEESETQGWFQVRKNYDGEWTLCDYDGYVCKYLEQKGGQHE